MARLLSLSIGVRALDEGRLGSQGDQRSYYLQGIRCDQALKRGKQVGFPKGRVQSPESADETPVAEAAVLQLHRVGEARLPGSIRRPDAEPSAPVLSAEDRVQEIMFRPKARAALRV